MYTYKSSEITVHKLNELKEEDNNIQILDVREDTERNHASVKGTIHIKLTEIANRHNELDSVNVLGGIDAWAALIDRDIRRY